MNPYEILGLSKECSDEEITIAYRIKAKKCHPDIGGNEDEFVILSIAVNVLRDPHKRKLFDDFGIVMDATESMIASKVEEGFNCIINEWINTQINSGREINLADFCEKGFNAALLRIQKELDKSKAIIKILNKRKGKIKTTDTINKVNIILEGRIASIQSAIKSVEEEKYILRLVKDVCAMYSSEEDVAMTMGNAIPRDVILQMMKEHERNSPFSQFVHGGFV